MNRKCQHNDAMCCRGGYNIGFLANPRHFKPDVRFSLIRLRSLFEILSLPTAFIADIHAPRPQIPLVKKSSILLDGYHPESFSSAFFILSLYFRFKTLSNRL